MLVAIAVPVDIENQNVYVAFNYAANYAVPRNFSQYSNPELWRPTDAKSKRDVATSSRKSPFDRKSLYKFIAKELRK